MREQYSYNEQLGHKNFLQGYAWRECFEWGHRGMWSFLFVTSTKGDGSLRKAGMGGDLRVSSDVCGLK